MCDPRPAPFAAYSTPVREAWIDYNDHLNDACYPIVYTEATEVFLTALGLGEAYHAATGCTTYTVEAHLRYLREVTRGGLLSAATLLVGADPKRVQIHHSLRNGAGDEVATGEFLYLHVNQHTGRVEPMPADRLALLMEVLAAHATQPRPAHLVLDVPRAADRAKLGP